MTSNVTYIDLDAVKPEVALEVGLDGQKHALKPITVEEFIANLRLMEQMGATGSIEKETEILVEMLSRAFPTIGKERLWKLTVSQLNELLALAKRFNGQDRVSDDVKAELAAQGSENPPKPTS